MKKLMVLCCLSLLACSVFSQSGWPAGRQGRTRPVNGGPASRQLTGSLVSTNYYVPGTTMDLTFELELTNRDGEYGDSLALTFPAVFTVNGSPDDPFPSPLTDGQQPEAFNGVSGQTLSWGDNDNTFGGIEPGFRIPFRVNVTVSSSASGPQSVSFFVSGDEFATPFGPLSGTVVVEEVPNLPIPRLDRDHFEALVETGNSAPSPAFTLFNIGTAAVGIDSVRLTGSEFTTTFGTALVPGLGTYTFSFTYTPTDLIDDVDTFFIYTDTTDFEIILRGHSYGNGVTLEGFEQAVFPPCAWQNIDHDGDAQTWFAYPFAPHGGGASAASASWFQQALSPDNYLILPRIRPDSTVPGKAWLRYWVAAQDPDFPAENYSVVVSTTDSSISSFNTTVFSETLSDTFWKPVTVDLKAYHGQEIFVAFRHHNVSDQFLFKIDDVRLPPLVNSSPIFPPIDANLSFSNQKCPEDRSGSARVAPLGGSGYYAVRWSTGGAGLALDSLGAGSYYVIVDDNCASVPDSQAFTIGFDNPFDDASFDYDEDTYCNTGPNPFPTVSGLAGGLFLASPGLVVNPSTGEINLAASVTGGPYSVIYQTNGPCPGRDTVWVSIDDCTGFEDLNSQKMEVFPNPNNGEFVLYNHGQVRKVEIEVLDIQGRAVFAETVQLGFGEKHLIHLQEVNSGVYLLKVQSEDQVGIERVMIR